MDTAISKFVKAADVIAMAVACHRDYRLASEFRDVFAQACKPEPAVDQEIANSSLDQPHVCAIFAPNSTLPYPAYTLRKVLHCKPSNCVITTEHSSTSSVTPVD